MWAALADILVKFALAFLEYHAAHPDTLTDAKTPETIRARWAAYLRDRLRDKDGGAGLPK